MPRILLAEGHLPTRELVQRRLVDSGFEVVTVEAFPSIVELFERARPDAVVLAADAPDGAALAQRLRELDHRLVLVALDKGHLGEPRGVQEVLAFGANGYVASPLGRDLADKLSLLIGQAEAARSRPTGVALQLSREPSARGELKSGVVARLIHQLWRSTADGVLVLESEETVRRLYFLRGSPAAAESSLVAESLAGWFEATGRLDGTTRAAVEEALAGGLSPGAALIAAGVLEPGEGLLAAMGAHLRAMLVAWIGARSGHWRFHNGDDFTTQLQVVEVLPLAPVLEGARAHLPVKHFADALKAVLDAAPTRTAECTRLVTLVGLGATDQRLLQGLDGRVSTKVFLEQRKADLKDVLSLLWFLSLIDAVVFHEMVSIEDGGPVAPATKPPLPPERAEAVRQAALRILPGTYFHALGVDIACDAGEVEHAYRDVAARFHPDAFAEWDVGDLDDLLLSVQDKVAAAHRVLVSPDKRRQYLDFLLLKFELAGVRTPGIVLDGELALKRGERALRGRRVAEAVVALREAAELNPNEPEYLAMLAFAELLAPSSSPGVRAGAAMVAAGRALELDPSHVRALVVQALAEELAGHHEAAQEAAQRALQAHPASELARRVAARVVRPRAGARP